jgi:hypothetical protein
MPWFRWLDAGLSLYMPGFSPMLVLVGFVVNRVAQGQVLPLSVSCPFSFIFYQCYIIVAFDSVIK